MARISKYYDDQLNDDDLSVKLEMHRNGRFQLLVRKVVLFIKKILDSGDISGMEPEEYFYLRSLGIEDEVEYLPMLEFPTDLRNHLNSKLLFAFIISFYY